MELCLENDNKEPSQSQLDDFIDRYLDENKWRGYTLINYFNLKHTYDDPKDKEEFFHKLKYFCVFFLDDPDFSMKVEQFFVHHKVTPTLIPFPFENKNVHSSMYENIDKKLKLKISVLLKKDIECYSSLYDFYVTKKNDHAYIFS
ncbi:hypothetical protein EBS02_11100 [bacterium]|nr:hypothetical protein [bacterium]